MARPPVSVAKAWARSKERLDTKICFAPRERKALAVFSLVSPAPIIMILRPSRSPNICSAKSTAMEPTETLPRVIAVEERTRLPT
jgi:hypothetical protein